MSTKINLEFVLKRYHPEVEGLPELREVLRIQCRVRFKTGKGYGEPEKAIVDTGAPISLIPFDKGATRRSRAEKRVLFARRYWKS